RRMTVLLMTAKHPGRAAADRLDRAAELAALHHLHVDDFRFRRDAKRLPGDRAGDRGPVGVAHLRIGGKSVKSLPHASLKLRVRAEHAAVEYIDGDAVTRAGAAIGPVERQAALIDTIER